MKTLLTKDEISLNLTRLLIAHVEELYPEKEDGADRFLSVLGEYKTDLERNIKHQPATFPELLQMKAAVREAGELLSDIFENEAERMVGWYAGCKASNPAHCISNILWGTIQEMSASVLDNEALFPELKFAFDRMRQNAL